MRPHKPTITTTPNGEAVEFTARYESPAWANVILGVKEFAHVTLVIGLSAAGGYWLLTTPLGLTTGQAVVMALAWPAGAWVASRALTNLLTDFRFGLLPRGDRRLRLTLSREKVLVNSGQAKGAYARGPALRFTAQAHMEGKFEARHAEWSRQHGPHLHRDSFQVWLQHGERVIELAATSSEDEANAIVRRLQAADELASRGAADTETFSNRSQPE
jgi:hypothetical protein